MAGENVVQFTDVNFQDEVLKSEHPVLVDFWAEWCGPCRMLAPTIEELATEFKGRVKVGKVDTDSNRNTAMQYNINAIPTIIVFNKGQLAKKFVGLTPKKMLRESLDALAAQPK